MFDAGVQRRGRREAILRRPDIIERLHATWVRLRSQMIRSLEAGSEITKLLLGWDDRLLLTEADVVAALQKLIHDKSIANVRNADAKWPRMRGAVGPRRGS